MLIPGYLEWNGFENPNVAIAALKLFRDIPDKIAIKSQLADGMRQAISRFEPGKLNGFERVLEGFQTVVGTPEPEPEPEPEPDPISPGSSPKKNDEPGGSYPAEFELVWQEYPKRAGANPKKSAFKAWNARRIVTTTVSGFTADVLRAEMIVEGMGYKVMNAEMIHNSCVEADK